MRFQTLKDYVISRLSLLGPWSLWVKAPTGLAVLAVLFLIFGTIFWGAFREWLIANESGSTTIRNLGLVAAGLIALPLAIWRGLVAEKQADAAQQSLSNERYQKGAEMLGHERLSVRLGGIYALQRLAKDYPEKYLIQIVQLLGEFVRYPTKDLEYEQVIKADRLPPFTREDVQTAVRAICGRGTRCISLERKHEFQLNFSSAKLSGMWLIDLNLSNTISVGTYLIGSNLAGADLSGAKFGMGSLKDALLGDADISGTLLAQVKGLTQHQLDQARADIDNPPKLEGVLDAETGQPLVWTGGRGAPLKPES